ncbi:MAG: hypothetical protein QG622_1167 [Actinomycetota bacterium]|nr:hypothetical protein [Actinomycetota bacterium]
MNLPSMIMLIAAAAASLAGAPFNVTTPHDVAGAVPSAATSNEQAVPEGDFGSGSGLRMVQVGATGSRWSNGSGWLAGSRWSTGSLGFPGLPGKLGTCGLLSGGVVSCWFGDGIGLLGDGAAATV